MKKLNRCLVLTLAAVSSVLLSASVTADNKLSSASHPGWKAECGSCHVAYPPSLLPAESWRVLMSGLDQHFGVDASVDVKSAAEIGAFLQQQAGKQRSMTTQPILRITETSWFKREHDEVGASVWKNPKVKTASNCAACHRGAEQGNYSERSIRLPR
jgi:Dihaem cytochrome c